MESPSPVIFKSLDMSCVSDVAWMPVAETLFGMLGQWAS